MKKITVFISIPVIILVMSVSREIWAKNQLKATAIWWGADFVELDIAKTKVLIDPYGRIPRKANLILITHEHSDHCHPASINDVLTASDGKVDLMVGSKGSQKCFDRIPKIQKQFAGRWETIQYKNLAIETVPSYHNATDIGYIVRDPKSQLSVMHLGDNNVYKEELNKLPEADYLFLAIGKMSFSDVVLLLKTVRPKYLIPMHFRPSEGAVLADTYDSVNASNPSEKYLTRRYLTGLRKEMEIEKFGTKLLIMKPGEAIELTR